MGGYQRAPAESDHRRCFSLPGLMKARVFTMGRGREAALLLWTAAHLDRAFSDLFAFECVQTDSRVVFVVPSTYLDTFLLNLVVIDDTALPKMAADRCAVWRASAPSFFEA